jgi:predicted permease
MLWVQRFWLRLQTLFGRNRSAERLDDEIQFHLEQQIAENVAAGMNPEEARHAAMRTFGNPTFLKEETRDSWGWIWLEQIANDVRYAARMLRKSPGFTAVAVLTLALGIGANSAIFSLLNAVVLRLLPIRDPQQLVQLTYTGIGDWNSYFGYPQLERFRSEARTLSGVFAGTGLGRMNVLFHGTANLAQGDAYTDNLFNVLGVTPEYGRLFADGDDVEASVVVLSDRYWRLQFGADPSVVGQTVTINQIPFTIVGIAATGFSGVSLGSAPDLWLPLHALDRFKLDANRWKEPFTSWLKIAGRLQPGMTRAQAQAELDLIHRRLLAQQLLEVERPAQRIQQFVRESHLVLRPAENGLISGLREQYALPLKLLMSIAGGVLLIACANLANLLLARASTRRREIAVRLGLGAGRGRVVRQLLTESILLASMGGVVALAVAWWGSAVLVHMMSTGDAPVPLAVGPDWSVFAFTAAVSLATVTLFGIAPAMRDSDRSWPRTERRYWARDAGVAQFESSLSCGTGSALDRVNYRRGAFCAHAAEAVEC